MWRYKDKFELKLKYDTEVGSFYRSEKDKVKKDDVIHCIADGFGNNFISVKYNNKGYKIYYKDIEYLKRSDGEFRYYDSEGNVTDTNIKEDVDIDPYGMCIYDDEYR